LLGRAMASPCSTRENSKLTVFAVTGPRHMLPFHDEDARQLASCLSQSPQECTAGSPQDALEALVTAEDLSDGGAVTSWSDHCASALAFCVPSGLNVVSASMVVR
jgi:hypothetical protein